MKKTGTLVVAVTAISLVLLFAGRPAAQEKAADDSCPIGAMKLMNYLLSEKRYEEVVAMIDIDEALEWFEYSGHEMTREELMQMMDAGFESGQAKPLDTNEAKIIYEKGPYAVVRTITPILEEEKEGAKGAEVTVGYHYLINKDGAWKYFAQHGAYLSKDEVKDEPMESNEYIDSRVESK